MKVFCINFQGIVCGQRANATAWWMFNVFRHLNPTHYIYMTSIIKGYEGSNLLCLTRNQWFFYKMVEKITSIIKIPYYIRRTLLEKIVDYYFYKKIRKEREPFLLISTMYAVRCTTYAKQHGCKVMLFAGNLNDNLYYKTVKEEQKRLGLKYTDVFCSDYRIKVYRQMYKNIDYVWCINPLSVWSFKDKKTILDPRIRKGIKILYPKHYDGPTPDKITVGYLGHTTLLKGIHLIPEALVKCKYKNEIEFVIAGSVDANVRAILNAYDNVNIKYLGTIPEDVKWHTIQSFDYMIIPSLYDAGPTTIIEAFKCDVPVIVSNGCGGVERVKNHKKCIVFETMNIQDLADKLDYAYEHRRDFLQASNMPESEVEMPDIYNNFSYFTDIIEKL